LKIDSFNIIFTDFTELNKRLCE